MHHHAVLTRWPVFLYDGTGQLRTGARYGRYGMKERSAVDLYNTLGHALGAPIDNFGATARNPSRRPAAGPVHLTRGRASTSSTSA